MVFFLEFLAFNKRLLKWLKISTDDLFYIFGKRLKSHVFVRPSENEKFCHHWHVIPKGKSDYQSLTSHLNTHFKAWKASVHCERKKKTQNYHRVAWHKTDDVSG